MQKQCELCKHEVANNVAVFTAVNDLISAGILPAHSYNALVERICANAGCPVE